MSARDAGRIRRGIELARMPYRLRPIAFREALLADRLTRRAFMRTCDR